MTTATDTKKETAASGVVHFANGEPLIRAISNGLLFGGKDDTLPMLTTIRFEFDGSTLTAVSTDCYRLCVETCELDPGIIHEGQPPFEFQLQRGYATQALTVLKANKRDKVTLVGHPESSPPTVAFQFYEQTASYPIDTDHTFPAYRSLIPDVDKRTAVDEIGFTYPYLADLGKVQTGSRNRYVWIRTYGATKPTRVDYLDGPTVVLMPIKVNSDGTTKWGAV